MRKSSESAVTVPDVPSFQSLIDAADSGSVDLHEFERSCGIPNRMLLPKGKKDVWATNSSVVKSPNLFMARLKVTSP
ncbi:hypothetical protein, partial [Salmonella enterica]|uniref:hypothetical protein n=1 Tax=Salmonella enterica TaxID=28901 RepID=UPI003D7677F2